MKDKNLPDDIKAKSLDELREILNSLLTKIETSPNLENSTDDYQKLIKVNNLNEKDNDYSLKIINIDLKFKEAFNVEKTKSSKFVIKSLNLAHKLAHNNNVSGIINCPISKTLLRIVVNRSHKKNIHNLKLHFFSC